MIRVIAVGKVKEESLKELINEYLKRISRYDKITIEEVSEEKIPQTNSLAQNEKAIELEGQRVLNLIHSEEYLILLDLKGKMIDSVELANLIDNIRTNKTGKIDFVIGGSLGVSPELIKRADWRWKLSDLTFPHQLARLLVLEQVYRSFKIQHHEPYHK